MFPTWTVAYNGYVDEHALAHAYHLLCTRHAMLRGRIRRDDHGYLLDVPTGNYPEVIVANAGKAALQQITEPWDTTEAVAHLIHIRGDSQGFVCLRIDHALVDFASYSALHDEFWRLYTAVATGQNVSVEPGHSLPRSPLELFRQRWAADIVPVTTARPLVEENLSGDPKDFCDLLLKRLQFSKLDTTQILAAARINHTTIGTITTGVIIASHQVHSNGSSTERVPIQTTVDLRKHVAPTVGVTDTTNFIGVNVTDLVIQDRTDPVAIARQYKAKLSAGIARREVHIPTLSTKNAVAFELVPLKGDDIWINSGGIAPGIVCPPKMEVSDYFLARPRERKIPMSTPDHYAIYTYNGSLNVFCHYPRSRHGSMQATAITDEIVKQFRAIGKTGAMR